MSISIWMLRDPGLHIPFSECMENQHMQTLGSDGDRVQGHSSGHFWSGQAVGWLKIAHTSQGRRHAVLHSRRSHQPAPPGSKPCPASCCKALSYDSQNSTDLLFHFLYFKSFSFHKGKVHPRMHWAIEISIFIFILFLCSISVTSPSSQPHHMYQQAQHHDLWQCMCPSRFFPFSECGMRAEFHVRKG